MTRGAELLWLVQVRSSILEWQNLESICNVLVSRTMLTFVTERCQITTFKVQVCDSMRLVSKLLLINILPARQNESDAWNKVSCIKKGHNLPYAFSRNLLLAPLSKRPGLNMLVFGYCISFKDSSTWQRNKLCYNNSLLKNLNHALC